MYMCIYIVACENSFSSHLLVLHEDVLESFENHLKHTEGTAQSLLGEQVTVLGICQLLLSAVF